MNKSIFLHIACLVAYWHPATAASLPDGKYRVYNFFQGPERLLTASGRLTMAPAGENAENQIWTLKNDPSGRDIVKLTNSEGKDLTLSANGRPSLSSGSDDNDILFKLILSPDTPEIWRLTSQADPVKCVGVQTVSGSEVRSLANQDYSGNYWGFEAVDDDDDGGSGTETTPTPVEEKTTKKPKKGKKQQGVVPDGEYRVHNFFQQLSRSLTAGGGSPKMAPTEDNNDDQKWTITNHPSQKDVVKLTSADGKNLVMSKGGQPSLSSTSTGDGHWFKLIVSPDTPKIWRLDSLVNPQTTLGVLSETEDEISAMPNVDLSGNYWQFESLDEDTGGGGGTGGGKGGLKPPPGPPPGPGGKKPTTKKPPTPKPVKPVVGGKKRSGQFRVGNFWQGLCRSLTGGGKLAKTAHSAEQFWTITDHPSMPNVIKLTSSGGQTLKMPSGGQPSVSSGSNGNDEWFKLVPSPNDPKFSRLVSLEDEGKCVSVESMSGTGLKSAANADRAGNYWSFDAVEKVTGVPGGFDPFYRKYISMKGIPIVSSGSVPDSALYQAYFIVRHMLSASPRTLSAMVRNRAKLAVMSSREVTTHIPEHRFLGSGFWDTRARGLGGTIAVPTASCAEENLLCYSNDKYAIEDITIHEFSHSVQNLGLNSAVSGFSNTVQGLYNSAIRQGKYGNTYARTNSIEYFAEGVQNWFNVNGYANPPNGIHNHVHDRASMKTYDPALYNLLAQHFPADTNKCSCH